MSAKWQLHPSQLHTIGKCAHQYRLRYIDGLKVPPGIAAIRGTGVDRAVTLDLRRKIETGRLARRGEIRAQARDYVAAKFEAGDYTALPEDRAEGVGKLRGACIDTAVEMVDTHHAEVAPQLSPVEVQQKWVTTLKGYPCDLAGTIDITELWPTGEAVIRDTKTGLLKRPEQSIQLPCYAMGYWAATGEMPASAWFDNLVPRRKAGATWVEAVSLGIRVTKEDFAMVLRRVEAAVKMIEAGSFPPANPDCWWCSPRWCGYYTDNCPYVRGRRSVLIPGE